MQKGIYPLQQSAPPRTRIERPSTCWIGLMGYLPRSDVYWVRLDPVISSEIAKTRPALIISNDVGNEFLARVIVALLTTGGLERVYPFEVLVPAPEGGLSQTSKVVLDQIRTIDKQRLGPLIGALVQVGLKGLALYAMRETRGESTEHEG